MKQPKNVIIVNDINTGENIIIPAKDKNVIVKTVLNNLEKEHDMRIESANFYNEIFVT
jgi:hypothetical protein